MPAAAFLTGKYCRFRLLRRRFTILHAMKLFLSAVFFLMFSTLAAKAQEPDCLKFHDGKFKLVDPKYGTFIITRKGDTQTEQILGDTTVYTFKVTWIDECTYRLDDGEKFKKDFKPLGPNDVFTVHIIKTTADSYTQISSSSSIKKKLVKTLFRIE